MDCLHWFVVPRTDVDCMHWLIWMDETSTTEEDDDGLGGVLGSE